MTDRTVGAIVRDRAATQPDGIAYAGDGGALTWAAYDGAVDALAAQLAGLAPGWGDRLAVCLPDSPMLHVAYTACERAGLVIVGIPERAGDREFAHLLSRTGTTALACPPSHRGRTAADLVLALRAAGVRIDRHAEIGPDGSFAAFGWPGGDLLPPPPPSAVTVARHRSPGDLWLLNSTSGTTGLPKCVIQNQARWLYFVRLAADAAGLSAADVIMSLVPGPLGFGLWTAHFAPPVLGAPCILQERFDAAEALRAVERHQVSVLACVTTQFVMMLGSPAIEETDLSSLRVLYTGGERVPPDKAREWERRTGSTVLQFYGSNEIGPFSCTSLTDTDEQRLTTVGRVIPGLEYRVYDSGGGDITASGGPGQPAARGPGVSGGYWDDPAANAELRRADGYLLMPDLVTIDELGYVRIVGRTSDLIIRGGKNISAASVESEVGAHPDVAMVAAIAVPDPVFGERVCAVVTLRDPATRPGLAEIVTFLAGRGVGKEYYPEYLAIIDEMPQSIGGKIAKTALRARIDDLVPQSARRSPRP